jgi:hypothetical protein
MCKPKTMSMHLITLLISILLLSACNSTTRIDEYRESPATIMNAEDTVVILGRRHSSGHETEIDFVSCVGKSLGSGESSMQVIPEQHFVDAMYPYFETSTAPMDVKNLDRLVQNPAIAEKFADFNLRFFIWIDGSTETTDKKGSVSCAIGPGGGGCFGFATWDDEANYEASIWDFKNLQLSGKINAETQGTSYMPAIIIPIPMLARVQSSACKSMAQQLKSFLQ